MADSAVLKAIKIKTGVLKRYLKEHAYYVKETEKLQQKVEKLKAEAQDEEEEYRAKKEEEVFQESRSMIGDTARRCATALADLKKVLSDANLDECQEVTDANEQIAAAATVCTA